MWFNHPKFKAAKKHLVQELSNYERHDTNSPQDARQARTSLIGRSPLPKILFICGGDPKYCSNRGKIEKYLVKHAPSLMTFRAEYAWDTISKYKNVNALELEKWLADFSDAVIILVESFGTVAELGAFSISEQLRRKLLPILDKKFEHDESFINTGPVLWVNKDSVYKPAIYADFDTILTSMPEVITRIDKKRPPIYNSRRNEDSFGIFRFTRKELLFLVILIIACIGPIDEKNIVDICTESFDLSRRERDEIKFIITLCVGLEIIQVKEVEELQYYTCLNYEKFYNNELTKNLLAASHKLRASCLSKLIYIDEFKRVMRDIVENAA